MSLNAYKTLASSYDELMSDYPYAELIGRLRGELVGKGFDIGAGSGIITAELALFGLDVIAVDPSEEMLTLARQRAREKRINPTFVIGSAESVELTPCNFVICTCDVLNYLRSRTEFEKFVKKVYSALKPDGKFVFDIRREEILKGMEGEIYYEDEDDLTYLWSNTLKRDRLIMDITFFKKNENGLYRREDESHSMLLLDEQYVLDTLKKVGFKVAVCGDGLKKAKKSDNRRFYFCTK